MKKLLWTMGYLGLVPGAPGTYASAVTAGLAGLALMAGVPVWGLAVLIVPVFAINIWVCPAAESVLGKDPSQFVIDETAGQLVAMLLVVGPVPTGWRLWAWVGISFGLFRLFDILKPPPVRQMEALPSGWGVALDDVTAGVLAMVVGNVIMYVFRNTLLTN